MKKKELVYQLYTPPRVIIRRAGTALFLKYSEIDWIEAKGLYTIFHSGRSEYPVRQNISMVEQSLDPAHFVRIHRSAMVNVERIRQIQTWFRGEYKVILTDGTELSSSRGFKDKLLQLVYAPADASLFEPHSLRLSPRQLAQAK